MNAKTTAEPASIYPALVRVTRAIATDGIGKTRDNKQQGYKFRGVDEVMNAFAPLLAKEGIFIRPHFTDRTVAERATKQGGTLFSVSVSGSFDFVAEDGSSVTVGPFYGEAMDSGDKATNKAMATAFKYAMFQTFCVPLEGVTGGDADAATHEVAPTLITDAQLSVLIDQCADTETDVVEFEKWLKIDALESLTADRYEYAINALKAKRRKIGKQAA